MKLIQVMIVIFKVNIKQKARKDFFYWKLRNTLRSDKKYFIATQFENEKMRENYENRERE